jgi:hypothetical protein
MFADNCVEAMEAVLTVAKWMTMSLRCIRLAICDVPFFEALFGTSFPVTDTGTCDAFFSLLLAWHRLGNADATAAEPVRWLSDHTKEKPVTFQWNVSSQEFGDLHNGQ